MFIMNGHRTELINTEYVQRFSIAQKEDACLIVAVYGENIPPVTVARYQSNDEAYTALYDLLGAIGEGEACYSMNTSTGCYKPVNRPQNGHNGRKQRNHGGS